MIWMLMLLATFANAQDVPYTNTSLDTERDPMVINKNFQDVVDGLRRGNLRNGGKITGQLELLNDGAGGGIKFNDGTTITTAPELIHTTSQAVRAAYDWGSAGRVCRSTLTVSGTRIRIHASGAINSAGSPWTGYAGYFIDSACPGGHTCHSTCDSNVTPYRHAGSASDADAGSFTIDAIESVSSGSHTVCIWACSSQGTSTTGTLLDFWIEGN